MSELLTADRLSEELERTIARLAPEWLAEHPELHERLLEILADSPDQLMQTMAYEQFLDWAMHNDIRAEWVDGKVFLMSPVSTRHQLLSVFLTTLLNYFVTTRTLGLILTAPFQMRLAHPPRGREPDLLFIASANLGRLEKTHLNGPADLVIEIVSPESTGRDRGEKFSEYEIAGISEYWLIDPEREQADFYQLVEGRYQLVLGGRTGRYTSTVVPGFWLEVEWLWQDPLPPVDEIWRQIGDEAPLA
jgi:Uma2 family endonuclease